MRPFLPPRVDGKLKTDALVVGDGIAGMSLALSLAERGVKPLVVTRGLGNTYLSQGGIAAAVAEDDSFKLHALDTLKAGRLVNDPAAVEVITSDAPRAIAELLSHGVPFDRGETFFELTLEAAHSRRRIFKVRDYTGRAIYETLHKRGRELGIEPLKGELIELYAEGDRVLAALLKTEGKLLVVNAKVFVLATGGAASLFAKNSNAQRVGGDALGIALRAGALLRDCEFVQFHPTVLAGTKYLISEAVRGEGATLVDQSGERFVNELAPRDEVARAIYLKLKEGKRVFLNFAPLVERGIKIEEKFPQIFEILKKEGFDPYRELIPVEPAAHYFIGGVAVDLSGKTALKNLYAVGECANTGFHGANRLASNSLLEGVVSGLRAADQIYLNLPFERIENYTPPRGELSNPPPFEEVASKLQRLMWDKVGIVRSGEGLREALSEIDRLLRENLKNFNSFEGRKLIDLLAVAKAVTLAALKRKESRGAHYREDYPTERRVFESIRFSFSAEELLRW